MMYWVTSLALLCLMFIQVQCDHGQYVFVVRERELISCIPNPINDVCPINHKVANVTQFLANIDSATVTQLLDAITAPLQRAGGNESCINATKMFECSKFLYTCKPDVDYVNLDSDKLYKLCMYAKQKCAAVYETTLEYQTFVCNSYKKTSSPRFGRFSFTCTDYPYVQNQTCPRRNYKVPSLWNIAGVEKILGEAQRLTKIYNITKNCSDAVLGAICDIYTPACTRDQNYSVSLIGQKKCHEIMGCLNTTSNALRSVATNLCKGLPDEDTAKKIPIHNVNIEQPSTTAPNTGDHSTTVPISADIEECQQSPCHPLANCLNTDGSYSCQCKKGYTGDGHTKCTDIDECQMKSLCTEGYDCVNTLGSYQCVCKGSIESDGKCTKGTIKRHRVNLRLNEDYKPQYANGTSEEFRAIETRITNAINKIYANNDNFRKVDVNELRNGSVIADLDLTFKDTDDSGVSGLLAAVRNNSFGDFEVDPDALTIVIIGTCPSDECPKNSTCKILTPSTISCPCDENFYFDGVNCAENVVIEIEITLEKPFVEALNNVSSPEYIELKRNVTAELTEVFKDTPNFQEVQVLGFRNGSTIVDFKVIYRQDRVLNNKVVVAEAIKKQLKNNKIRNLALKFGTGVKLGGTPDPPTDLKQTDVTEDRIDISWGEPVGARFFQINGYIISYKTVSESQYKTVNVSAESSVKILVLSDLESDTFYTISVHAYNDDGDGDKVTIQVTTKDTDSPVVIIVVVVIVCVLLIIVMVVIFIQLRRRRKRQHLRSPRPHPDRDVMKLTGFQPGFENKAPGDEEMSGSQTQNL